MSPEPFPRTRGINHLLALLLSKAAVNTIMPIAWVKKTRENRKFEELVLKATEGPVSTPQIIQMPQDPNTTGALQSATSQVHLETISRIALTSC